MALALCTVSFEDGDNVRHAVSVYAESAYEAAAMALKLLRADPLTTNHVKIARELKIETKPEPIVHTLSVNALEKWADNLSGSPAMRSRKLHIKALLTS